ncbi:MAG TPA: MFS transporter, partial [Candidatus Dormibacteraeota bacterium]|nr:MFS transporter [Candidatus Dormibacteraeota bacterium]
IVGYPLAGLVLLWSHNQTTALFLLDGLTFLGSALLSRNLTMGGGGDPELRLHSAYATVLNAPKIWLHLATAAIAAGFVSMTLSTLLLLAYQIGPNGGEAYTILETVLTAGVAAGTWVIGKWRRLPAAVAVTLGLGTMGVMSVLLSLSPNLWLASVILFVASIGNPLYVVGNQKGFLDAVPQSQHGRAMAVRFGVTQVASLTGLAISGPLNAGPGPRTTYFLVALGLIILAVATGIGNRRVRTSANS